MRRELATKERIESFPMTVRFVGGLPDSSLGKEKAREKEKARKARAAATAERVKGKGRTGREPLLPLLRHSLQSRKRRRETVGRKSLPSD